MFIHYNTELIKRTAHVLNKVLLNAVTMQIYYLFNIIVDIEEVIYKNVETLFLMRERRCVHITEMPSYTSQVALLYYQSCLV